MKTPFFLGAALAALVLQLCGADPAPPAPNSRLRVLILDDQSSSDLQRVHGITRTTDAELRALAQFCLNNSIATTVGWLAVDECSLDDTPVLLELPAFTRQPPAMPQVRGLTSTQIAQQAAALQTAREEFDHAVIEFGQKSRRALDEAAAKMLAAQMEVDVRFARLRGELRGRDFPRSDVAGAITALAGAGGRPAPGEMRLLLLRTDGADCPGGREPKAQPYRARQTTALTEAQLPRDVVLVFLNTSGQPDEAPLFAGAPNARMHFADLGAFLGWLRGDPPAAASAAK